MLGGKGTAAGVLTNLLYRFARVTTLPRQHLSSAQVVSIRYNVSLQETIRIPYISISKLIRRSISLLRLLDPGTVLSILLRQTVDVLAARAREIQHLKTLQIQLLLFNF